MTNDKRIKSNRSSPRHDLTVSHVRPAELETLCREIEHHAKESDEHVIAAAMLMREARERVEGGELGVDVKWCEWALENIKLSASRLRDLQSIAEAADPAKELERQRELKRRRAEKRWTK